MKDKATRKRITDIIGLLCSVLMVVAMAGEGIYNANLGTAGASKSQIPADALTLYGTGEGINGDVTVEVIATEDQIYRIKVVDHAETQNIGTRAIKQLPQKMYDGQTVKVDDVTGATVTSTALKQAVSQALESGGLDIYKFGGGAIVLNTITNIVDTSSGVKVIHAADWESEYPEIYESYMKNSENSERVDYTEEYPMIKTLFEGYGFAKSYTRARGHTYTVNDVSETGRPHAMANCFSCKTPDFTAMTLNMGDEAYTQAFEDVLQEINDPISCFNCHANTPGVLTVTHTYLVDAMGDDIEHVDAADLSCGQCHVEYYMDPDSKAVTLPYSSLDTMTPDAILEYYNNLTVDGEVYADFVHPRSGVRLVMVNHPEYETYLGEGSVHRGKFTCADCHMGEVTSSDGTTYASHNLTSPLDNEELIENTCSACHSNLKEEVKAIQEKAEKRTNEIGYELEDLTNRLADAAEDGSLSNDDLEKARDAYRSAQFYWTFVFVENSEGAHNSRLTDECLDKAESYIKEVESILG